MKYFSLPFLFLFLFGVCGKAEVITDSIPISADLQLSDTIVPSTEDSIGYRSMVFDDTYLNNIEILLDQKEKEQQIRNVINGYENRLLKQEMAFDWWSSLPFVRGLILSSTTSNFKNRNSLFEYHQDHKWEYGVAMIPLAVSWGLKSVGVESRSKTSRMVLANALGFGFTCGLTSFLKHVADEKRPDGHDNHSMPSGHSALAFFSAAVLDREFGHHSPWISVAGYATAMATQYRRIHYNHHYLNDVVTGAGIGILSANLGYFLTDRILGSKAINKPKVTMADFNMFQKYVERPTSFTLVSGFSTGYNRIPYSSYDLLDKSMSIQLRTTAGYKTQVEYDYFLNKYWAIDVMASMAQYKVQALSNNPADQNVLLGNNIYQYHFDIGGKFSLPVSLGSRVEFRAFAGERFMPSEFDILTTEDISVARIKKNNDFEFGAGLGINMLSSSKYVTGISCDYVHACSSLMRNRWVIGSFWKILL